MRVLKYTLKQDEAVSRERHRAFWKNDSLGVPLVFALANKEGFVPEPWSSDQPRKDWDLSPDWHRTMVENYLNGAWFMGDAMPVAGLMVGLDITNTAVLAGGDYDYSSTGSAIDFKPGRFNLDNPVPAFDSDHFLVRQLRRCYEHVIASVRNRACVNTPMTLDALSSIFSMCGGIPFLTDMIQKKKVIQKRTEELTDVYLRFYDYFYDFLKAEGYGESASWFQVFAEGKFESVRCDFSLMISNGMFDDFVVPELTQVCDHMDYSLFNMCSVRHARFVEPLSRIRSLNGIFWNPEPYLDGIRDYLPVLRDIKEKGMCLEIVCQSVDEAVLATQELGPDGLYLFFENRFADSGQARKAIEKVYDACR